MNGPFQCGYGELVTTRWPDGCKRQMSVDHQRQHSRRRNRNSKRRPLHAVQAITINEGGKVKKKYLFLFFFKKKATMSQCKWNAAHNKKEKPNKREKEKKKPSGWCCLFRKTKREKRYTTERISSLFDFSLGKCIIAECYRVRDPTSSRNGIPSAIGKKKKKKEKIIIRRLIPFISRREIQTLLHLY